LILKPSLAFESCTTTRTTTTTTIESLFMNFT
jgi:hypothetical protein